MSSPAVLFNQLAEQCQGEGLTKENVSRIANELARSFGVHDDEIAIFRIEREQLKFIHPTNLSKVGMIPLNHSSAVASRTANSKRPEAVNNFAQMRHASVFESVPLDSKTRGQQKPDQSAMVIQKMMSVPVISPAGVVGVIQVSRKGASVQAAGPDFLPADLHKLVVAAQALAKCFK